MATKKRRRSPTTLGEARYTGLLAELPSVYPALYDPDNPPHSVLMLWSALGHERLDWKQYVREAREKFSKHRANCKKLLCQYYGIDVASSDADSKLLDALLEAHVPAFQVERALKAYHGRKSKKPIKLDVYGSTCFFLHEYIADKGKERALSTAEQDIVRDMQSRLASYKLGKSTTAQLRREMGRALGDYFCGRASEFQKQFVELVSPRLFDLFQKIEANRVPRTPQTL